MVTSMNRVGPCQLTKHRLIEAGLIIRGHFAAVRSKKTGLTGQPSSSASTVIVLTVPRVEWEHASD